MEKFFDTSIELQIKTYDIDFAGVVSNIVYVRWLEDLRLAMLAKHYPLNDQLNQGLAPAIVQTRIDYKKALSLFDRIYGRIWVSDIQKIKVVINFEILHNQEVAAFAEQTGLFVELTRKRPVAIPDDLKAKYETW
ncbi:MULTISPECIES: acyl-CoA thioesterase [unclassified Nostoc]|nr:thioesterase family protein [Nostoc sp. S13]MDF5738590.1 thioesterase family protein [Nostoc sp. S13]